MKKITPCNCQSKCKTALCSCLKSGFACTENCQCYHCKNPFNQIDQEIRLTNCARQNIKEIASLPEKSLLRKYKLPCECGTATLKDLFEDYPCPKCGEIYCYSFCLSEVVDTYSIWHCNDCKTCREDSEWHCKKCGNCTYGLTLPCENCGKKSPYMP